MNKVEITQRTQEEDITGHKNFPYKMKKISKNVFFKYVSIILRI